MSSFDSKLTEEELTYYLKNEDKIKATLRSAFKTQAQLTKKYTVAEEAKMTRAKTSFNEVFMDYVKATQRKDHTYKPTADYRSTRTDFTDKSGVDPLNKHYDFAFDNNVNLAGSTWDVKHLDAFLETSEFGRTDTFHTTFNEKKHLGILSTKSFYQKELGNRSRSLASEGGTPGANFKRTQGPDAKGGDSSNNRSAFFSAKKRMPNNPLVFYDFPAFYSKYSSMNPENPDYGQMAKFFEQNFTKPVNVEEEAKPAYPISNLAPPLRPSTTPVSYLETSHQLQLPSQRISEMKQVNANQKGRAIEKEDKLRKQKKFRVIHGAHRSGVMGIDHPLNPETLLYNGEDAYERFRAEERRKIQEKRQTSLTRHEGTHPGITFLNPRSTKRIGEDKIVKEESTNPLQHSKKRVNEPFKQKWDNSSDRIFGTKFKNFSLNRAQFIHDQETRSRGFDIIAQGKNQVELKIDRGENLLKE